MDKEIKIMAISGSLRQQSSNTSLLNAIIGLSPENMNFTIYGGLGDLPHFNPDIDVDEGPDPVRGLRTQLKEADGVLICTPEYGNGVPVVLKTPWIGSYLQQSL